MKNSLILIAFIFSNSSLFCQNLIQKKIELGSSYSYTGFNGLIGIGVTKNSNEFGCGFRTSFTHYSRYNNSNFMGMYVDYNRKFQPIKKITPLINLHYGNLFRKIKSPINSDKALFNIHELYLCYGLNIQMGKIVIVNAIGYGAYMERQKNFYLNEQLSVVRPGALVKIAIKYEW